MDFDHVNELIKNLSGLQKERDVFADRIDKLNEKSDSISEVVYNKIKGDYSSKVQTLNSEIYPLLEELSLRKSELHSEIKEYEDELKEYMVEKEEIEVRKELGEFKSGEAEKLLSKLEKENSGNFDILNKLKESMDDIENALESEVNNNDFLTPEFTKDEMKIDELSDIEEIPEIDEDYQNNFEEKNESFQESLPPLPPQIDEEGTLDGTITMEPQVNFSNQPNDGESTMLFSSPVLEIVSGSLAGTEYRVKMGTTNIGSDQNNDIYLDDVSVSPKHAQITFGPDGFTVFDFKSESGIEVNGQQVSEYLLKNDDIIQIGDILVKFLS